MTDPTSTPTPTNEQQDARAFDQAPYLARALNWASIDALANTPDYVLAEKLAGCPHLDAMFRAYLAAVSAAAPDERDVDPAWLRRTVEVSRAYLDGLPASARPAWYRARVNGEDAWWESLVQAECDAGHVIFIDDGDGTVYACPACALAEARAALAACPTTPTPTVSGADVERAAGALMKRHWADPKWHRECGRGCTYRMDVEDVLAALGITVADARPAEEGPDD